jgi:hypothetical protein
MKPKLENLKEVLKVLEKQYEIPKHLYQIEFPKKQKKTKKRIDTIWKDYTIFLFVKKRLSTCIRMIQDKCKVLSDEVANLSKDRKTYTYNRKKMIEKLHTLSHLVFAAFDGFGIAKEKSGKCYLKNGQSEKFLESLSKKYGNDLTKITPKLRSFEYDNSKIKDEKTIIKFPDRMKAVRAVVEDIFYWEQWHKLYKNELYNKKLFKKPIDAKENKSFFRKQLQEFWKRSTKITEPKYNLNFFMNYEPKFKRYWTRYWRFFLKIR